MNRKERQSQVSMQRRSGQMTAITPGSPLAKCLEAGARLRHEGKLAEAEVKLENALALDRDHPRCLLEMANLQRTLDQPGKAAMNIRKALRAAPKNAQLAANLAATLRDMGELEESLEAFQKSLEWKPDFHQAMNELGVTYQMLRQPDQAAEAFESSLALDGKQPSARVNLAFAKLELGDAAGALESADIARELDPLGTATSVVRSFALRELGKSAEADAITDLNRWISSQPFDKFEGYDSVEQFNAALVKSVMSHSSLKNRPNQRTTRIGQQTGELNREEEGPIACLRQAMDERVQSYVNELSKDTDHPFASTPPNTWKISLWGTILDDGGHQDPHIHPVAWMSGVYYAQVPDTVSAEDTEKAGWIEFGRAPDDFTLKQEAPLRLFQPEEGTLLTFPSYLYHRTLPYLGKRKRVSVAMDVIRLS
jgi:uncharacterized protein (TIGR02466 family)